ncbi:hypothetical protein KDK77_08410, partial [bacterium]|nr:hypothetical protein [bacterium]
DTGEGFHAVDAEGTLLSPYVLSPERRPIVLDLASSIDPDRNQRLKTIQNQILQTYSTLQTTAHQAPPAIIITTPDTPFYDTLREIAQAELQNAAVFVSAWMPADDGTPEINQDLLPKIARIITYLNQRGIVPLLPIPSFSPLNNKARREFIQYISRHLTSRDRVQYVTFDELGSNSFITVDSTGRLLTAHTIGTQSPAIIVHGASGAETRNAAQLEQITEQIQFAQSAPSPATQFKHPLFIRIPTAGTTLTPLDGLDIVNVHMASSPRADEGVQSLKTGFMADAELLDLISKIRAIGKPHFRRNTILQINDLFEQRIQSALAQQPGFNLENLDSLPWSFRYLTEKSDAELAAFMKAAVRTGNPQVIFTFYRDNTDVDIRHKTFLKQNFKFLDLQQQNNDALDTDSSVLIINLPPLSSGLFKALMASADTATVSGENSLLESLALNKFGVGPLPLFRPAIAEHLEILQAPLTSQNHSALLEKTLRYVQLDDAEPPDALARWNTETPVSPVENDLIAALSDPETQLFWKSALADIVAPVNGLNTLTSIIGELDRATPIPDIITTHNQAVQSDAYALADAFIDSPLDHTSSEGQQEFIESSLADFVKSIVMNAARRRLDATSIRPLLNTAVRHIVKRYNDSLHKLSPLAALQATQRFEQKLYTALAGIDIVGKGHLFIPFYRNGQLFYSYSFVDFNVFHPDPALRGIPVVRESTVSAPAKKRIAQDILDTQYVKSFLSFIAIQDALGAQYAKELPHTFSGTSDQIDQANDFIARTAVPLFRQTAQENAAVLTEHYGTASVAALYAYYFDYRSSISLADPGDNALIDRLTRITAALYQTPFDDNPTFFFRGNENGDWLTHMEDNLHTLIAQKTALHDFTLTARSIGASVGKEPYTQAAIIQNALRRFAYSSVYADTRMDKQKRDQLVEQWVDSWDVRIYAFERSFQRSITTQAGVYRVLPQENYFFTSPEGQNYISLFENGQTLPNPTEEFQRHGIISQRLKNWVIPVLSGDLSANPRILAEYPAEITFMMNMLTYLANDNARMNLYRFALDSSSTAYRSFVMYNETFDAPPSNHFILDELPYTIPPLTIPFLSHIDAVSQIIHSVDKPALSRELGVYTANRAHHYTFDDQRVEVQIAGTETRFIETGQFYSPSMLDGIVDDAIVDVYLQLYTLVSSLSVNPDSPEQTQEAQQQFAAQQLPEFLRQFILFMINKGIEENIMNDYIADAQKVLSSLYARTLRNTSEEFAQKMLFSWNDAIDSVFSGIEITEEFDIFIPFGHGLLFYLQYGIPVFNKDNPADDSVTAVTRIIPAHTKSRVISDSRDKAAIAEILQLFVFDEWFTLERFPSLRASWSKTPELYQSNSTHSMFIREHVAASLVPSFNRLVQNYAGLLTTHYGNATLDALRQFIIDAFIDTSLLDDPALIGSLTPDTAQRVKLASDIRAIIERLRDDREEDGQPSVTGFFRPASGWNEYTSTITGYFNDLILQKTARNDYSITIKDIGASTGKEALSIAAMLEASLLNYA